MKMRKHTMTTAVIAIGTAALLAYASASQLPKFDFSDESAPNRNRS